MFVPHGSAHSGVFATCDASAAWFFQLSPPYISDGKNRLICGNRMIKRIKTR